MTSAIRASIPQLAATVEQPWQPLEVARVNDAALRLARLHGEFPWHHHDEDELFLCWSGQFRVEIDGEPPVDLGPGDLVVVGRGVRHRPVAPDVAYALLLERPETRQYGN